VAAFINEQGQPEIIPDLEGGRITPSVFTITKDNTRLVGKSAINQESLNSENTIRSIKRQMGTSDRLILQNATLSPEEISAEIIKKLKINAEQFLNETIESAVITVPAYFNNDQRQATKTAGELAGLKVLRIINEPTAASLAYGLDKKKNEKILVFDLGGGTFDVTILQITSDGIFEVKSTSGDTHLGGDDFDKLIYDQLLNELLSKNINPTNEAKVRIRDASEQAKKQLSSTTITTINLPFIDYSIAPIHLTKTITREDFEIIADKLLERIKNCVDNALNDAKMKPENIDEIVFVGGSTRMPIIEKSIKTWMGKIPNHSINPDEAVAIGAAIQAGMLTGEKNRDILLLDVIPLSLGIETLGGVMTTMITRNTTIPTEYSDIFSTAEDEQKQVIIKIYQGERPQVKNNKFLGDFILDDILPVPRGIPQIEVTFDVNVNGILSVHAIDKETNQEQKITISGNSSLSENDIQKIVEDAKKNKEEDDLFKEFSSIKMDLQQQLIQLESILRESKDDLDNNLIKDLESCKKNIEESQNKEEINELTLIKENTQKVITIVSQKIYEKADEYISGN
jgi:molecular chaperone DnaK